WTFGFWILWTLSARFPVRSVVNKVAEVFQFDGEIDVVDHHFLGHLQDERGEIQDAGDARFDELVGDFLGDDRRYAQDCHADAAFADKPGQVFHALDRLRDRLFAFPVRIDVERGHNLE